ncbi:amidohydrolase family protein, partial [Streptomyces fulvoviolaceus]
MPDSQPQPPHSSSGSSSGASSGSSSSSSSGSSSSSSGSSSGSWAGSAAGSAAGQAEGAALLLCGARLTDGRTVDVRLGGGRIEAVGTTGSLAVGGTRARGARVDLSGYLLLPAPVEPHAHGDTALSDDVGGPVSYDPEDVQRRSTEAALLQLGHGATALRAHVRVGDVQGLGALAAVLQARRSLRGLTELTAVAMPRVLTGVAGADGLAILRDAVKMGASVVGGCPDLDPDPTGYVEAVLEVASEHGCPVDLHTDATDPARLARLAAMAGGLRPGVTLGPCGGLGRLPAEVASRTADQLAAAGVAVVCLPQGGCGGVDRRGTAPVRLLRAAGVQVAAGSGALRDVSNPVGRGDPLEAAYLLASRYGLRPEDAYDAVSASARAVLGLPEVRVEAGFPAELLAVRGDRLAGALSLAYSRIVVHRGRVVARTSAVR